MLKRAVVEAVKPELVEKDVYGADARSSEAGRFDGDQIERWTPGLKIPVVIGFRPNEER